MMRMGLAREPIAMAILSHIVPDDRRPASDDFLKASLH